MQPETAVRVIRQAAVIQGCHTLDPCLLPSVSVRAQRQHGIVHFEHLTEAHIEFYQSSTISDICGRLPCTARGIDTTGTVIAIQGFRRIRTGDVSIQ